MTSDVAFSIGLFAGWLALLIAIVWQDPRCPDCNSKYRIERRKK